MNSTKSKIVLMVQSARRVYCYFSVSPLFIKEFSDKHGEALWSSSKPVLKVYELQGDEEKEIESIFIDTFADNWYIDLNKDAIDILVKLKRLLPDNTYIDVATSNKVTTPRMVESQDTSVYYKDIKE